MVVARLFAILFLNGGFRRVVHPRWNVRNWERRGGARGGLDLSVRLVGQVGQAMRSAHFGLSLSGRLRREIGRDNSGCETFGRCVGVGRPTHESSVRALRFVEAWICADWTRLGSWEAFDRSIIPGSVDLHSVERETLTHRRETGTDRRERLARTEESDWRQLRFFSNRSTGGRCLFPSRRENAISFPLLGSTVLGCDSFENFSSGESGPAGYGWCHDGSASTTRRRR